METVTNILNLIIPNFVWQKIQEPKSQRIMVLVIVCVALLLDNMLYMVIVPIIPHYLSQSNAFNQSRKVWLNGSLHIIWPVQHSHSIDIGFLFASKAIVQLLINPISGAIIDRIGYDKPMIFGLSVIFLSTSTFAFGDSYGTLLLARSLQGVGSAFADTSGLAMIADRFTDPQERTKSLGIALAFISFGSLVAPPFGGILYQVAGKSLPFMALAFIALLDGVLMFIVMQPARLERRVRKAEGQLPQGTPMYVLLRDRDIAICAGALAMSNVSLAFLEPTIADWMEKNMDVQTWQLGMVWLPAFFPHVAGVYTTVILAKKYRNYQWLMVAIGLAMEGISSLFIPFCKNYLLLMVPICVICYGIALVDTAVLPALGHVVDTRYVSVYGSVYAIADISYSLAYAFGPVVAGGLETAITFLGLNIVIFLTNILYAPLLYFLKDIYKYDNLEKLKETNDGEDGEQENRFLKEGPVRQYMMNGSQADNKIAPQLHDVDASVVPTTTMHEVQPPHNEPAGGGGYRNVPAYNRQLPAVPPGGAPHPSHQQSSRPPHPAPPPTASNPSTTPSNRYTSSDKIKSDNYGY